MSLYKEKTIKSKISAERRHYPREPKGEKNEWKALINHYSEIGDTSNLREMNYKMLKDIKQKESKQLHLNLTFLALEDQMKERSYNENMEKRINNEIEKELLMRDQQAEVLYNKEQRRHRNDIMNTFKNGNEKLMRLKNEIQARDVIEIKLFFLKKLEDLQLDHEIIRNDLNGDDLNYLRAKKRAEEAKRVYLENQLLEEKKSLYSKSPSLRSKALSSFSVPKHIMYKSEGDIFDTIFSRPYHRKKVLLLLIFFLKKSTMKC